MAKPRVGVIGAGSWAVSSHLPNLVRRRDAGEIELDIVNRRDFDLVVLDFQVHKESGLEQMQHIGEEQEENTVILCTAYSCYKDDFSSWLADAYVVKSSNLDELKREVRRILAQK